MPKKQVTDGHTIDMIIDDTDAPPRFIQPHHRKTSIAIVMLEDASGIVICKPTWRAEEVVISVTLAPRSSLTLSSIIAGQRTFRLTQSGIVGAGAAMSWQNITLDLPTFTGQLTSEATDDSATSNIEWIASVRDKQHMHCTVRNSFLAGDGRGDTFMKGVAEHKGKLTLHGQLAIGPGGDGTDVYLTQDVLMLDPTATVSAIPSLEIKTNNVKASHSAVITRVTAEDLFYFGSRCIPPAMARTLFIRGFLCTPAAQTPVDPLREAVEEIMDRHLGPSSFPLVSA